MEWCRFERKAPRFTNLCEETRHCDSRVVNSPGTAQLSSNMRRLLESDKKRQSTVCSWCFTRDRTPQSAVGWIPADPPCLFLFNHAPLCCIHPTSCLLCVPPNQLPCFSAHSIESFFAKPETRWRMRETRKFPSRMTSSRSIDRSFLIHRCAKSFCSWEE